MIAISATAKQWVDDTRAGFSGPSKTKEEMGASQREIVDALIDFAEAHRYVTESDDEGNTSERDRFAEAVEKVIASRLTTERTRTNTAKIALEKAEAELAEVKAKLAALEAAGKA